MKKIFVLLLSIAGLVGVANAQTADEIINKHLEARGGIEKIKSLQTMILEGSMNQGGTDIQMKFYYAQNKGTKVEFSVMGQTGYNIVTPSEGWAFNPFAGNTSAEPLPEAALKEAQLQLDLQGPLVDYKSKGNTIEFLGKESVQGEEFLKLKLTRSGGKATTYYFNKNYLISKSVTIVTTDGIEKEVTTEYSDYRKTPEGFMVAFKRNNGTADITFEKATINSIIDDSVFKPSN
ncbi:MAG: LolA family protein [Chitinophagaceae bacterium]